MTIEEAEDVRRAAGEALSRLGARGAAVLGAKLEDPETAVREGVYFFVLSVRIGLYSVAVDLSPLQIQSMESAVREGARGPGT